MAESQKIGAAVALRSLGYRGARRSRPGPIIADVNPKGPSEREAASAGDAIVSVDGQPTSPSCPTSAARSEARAGRDGPARRSARTREPGQVEVKTVADPENKSRPLIGILTSCRAPDRRARSRFPCPFASTSARSAAPRPGSLSPWTWSRSSATTWTRATGSRRAASSASTARVVPVGGLKQKTIGAKRAGVDVFLVPAGENAEEARRYAGSMKVVPVKSFRQALQALATLPEERTKS